MARLPTVLGDVDGWGTVLNDYLAVAHNAAGTSKQVVGPVFNVADDAYGAAPAASASANATAINAAIVACNAAGGGTVFVPAGSYLVSGTPALTMKANVWLRGAGKDATVLKLANTTNHNLVFAQSISNVTISDLTLDGNKANQTTNVSAGVIRSNVVSRLTVINVRIINAYEGSISATTTTDSLVFGCDIEASGQSTASSSISAIWFRTNSDRNRVLGNRVDGSQWHGIGVAGIGDIVTGNIVRNPVGSGAICIATAGSTDAVLQGNYCTSTLTTGNCIDIGDSVNCSVHSNVCVGGRTGIDWDSGVSANRGNKNSIVGNVCHGFALFGISANGAGTGTAGNGVDAQIVGNVIDAQGAAGSGAIRLDTIRNGVIANNICKNAGGNAGIALFATGAGGCSDITITGNRCYDDQGTKTQTYGIQSVSGGGGTCDFNLVVGNNTRGNLTGGVLLVGSNNVNANNL